MKKNYIIFCWLIFFCTHSFAQVYTLDNFSNGETFYTCSGFFYDDGGVVNPYSPIQDRVITFCRGTGALTHSSLVFSFDSTFSINSNDTLYIYDGPDIHAPALNVGIFGLSYANNSNSLQGLSIHPSSSNISNCLTFRFKSYSNQSAGWAAKIECKLVCQDFTISLDSTFFKIVNGNRIPNKIHYNNKEYKQNGLGGIDTIKFNSIDICKGDSLGMAVKTNFLHNNEIYRQSDQTTKFYWSFGDNRIDTASGTNAVHQYPIVDGYNLIVMAKDTIGCVAYSDTVRVRIAWNPIKQITPMPELCIDQTFQLNAGYHINNKILLDSVAKEGIREIYDSVLFIPDGPRCEKLCYETGVTFEQYMPGTVIQSGTDICSVCITAEHTYLGDLSISLVCPTGQKATLKQRLVGNTSDLGIPPYGPNNFVDRQVPGQPPPDNCTQAYNAPGIGWQYCWSEKYSNNSQGHMGSYTNGHSSPLDSSDFTNRSKFYIPDSSFNNLIGCPYNGEWHIEICDYLSIDKGYIFNWSLEFCNISSKSWGYKVPLDTIIWQGAFLHNTIRNSTDITPTTSGNFIYNVSIIDSFGCHWDTIIPLAVLPDPSVNLGNDTILCPGSTLLLDATFPGEVNYLWNNGNFSPTQLVSGIGNYSVSLSRVQCPEKKISDTIYIAYYDPLNVNIGNDTILCPNTILSLDATIPGNINYLWNNGDTISTQTVDSPGIYQLSLYRTECPNTVVSDAINIEYYGPFYVELGNDTIICSKDSIILSTALANGNFYYLWNNGNINPLFVANEEGNFWVKVSRVECPEQISGDTIKISHYSDIRLNLEKEGFICNNEPLILDAIQKQEAQAFYRWQDGSTNPTYTALSEGKYWVTVYNICEQKSDTAYVIQPKYTYLHLPADTSFCRGDGSIHIIPEISDSAYYRFLWSDGVTTFEREIHDGGAYWLKAQNYCYTLIDTIVIVKKDCESALVLPNAFTPGIEPNAYFFAVRNNRIKDLHIRIYSRWGEELYQSKNLNFKWDGKDKKGTYVPAGSYVYIIEYHTTDEPNITLQLKGNINIIR